MFNPSPSRSLDRSGTAAFFSINHLLHLHDYCYLWTFTLPSLEVDSYISGCRARFFDALYHRVDRGHCSAVAGVRVTEVHPNGHGLHDHMVITAGHPLFNGQGVDRELRQLAKKAGYGRIGRDPDECRAGVSVYLSAYLTKRGDHLAPGMRAWQNFGAWQGVRCRDVVYDSEEIEVFRRAFREGIAGGLAPQAAYVHAKRVQIDWRAYAIDDWRFDP